MSLRLQKWMSQLGVTSRREAERWIRAGRVSVNGETVRTHGFLVDPDQDRLFVDDKEVKKGLPPKVYWMFHKPDHSMTTKSDPEGRRTIYDLPTFKEGGLKVESVGRLDFRTEGLLLLSNDGEWIHRLSHPRHKLSRTYWVRLNGKLSSSQLRKLRESPRLPDGPVSRVKIDRLFGGPPGIWYEIVVWEGRNRLVRRLIETVDQKVLRLVRVGFGPVRLSWDVAPGTYRHLTHKEMVALRPKNR